MAYIVLADFRSATLAEYCQGLPLTADEAPDTLLTLAIARLSQRLDDWTNDHFETLTDTLELDGDAIPRLFLTKRCTAITTVKTRDYAGTLTTQPATVYRLHSSLDAAGAKRIGDFDWLDIIPQQTLTQVIDGNGTRWPAGPQTVQVAGTFGWTTTPTDVKRAVALLVWEHFKALRGDLRRAARITTTDQSIDYAASSPSGIPEVDDIVAEYIRPSGPGY